MKHTYSFSISLLLSFIYLFHASAQPYVIKRLGVEDGMSSNYVVSVTQDKKGYLWIATESGLNRFDGRQFNIYTKNNSGLSGNELNVVLADPYENKVWIGTQRDGLCYFDYETETISRIPATGNYMLSNDITDLSVAADSGLWITHYHFGVDYYDRKTKLFTPYSSKNVKGLEGNNWVSKEDGNGNLYIGHHLRGLSIVSLKDRTAKNYQHDPNNPYSIPDNEVRALCIDKNKNVCREYVPVCPPGRSGPFCRKLCGYSLPVHAGVPFSPVYVSCFVPFHSSSSHQALPYEQETYAFCGTGRKYGQQLGNLP